MMNTYRIYVLNRQDRIADALEENLPGDRQALERAEDLFAGQYAAEVWDGERLVGRIGGDLQLG